MCMCAACVRLAAQCMLLCQPAPVYDSFAGSNEVRRECSFELLVSWFASAGTGDNIAEMLLHGVATVLFCMIFAQGEVRLLVS